MQGEFGRGQDLIGREEGGREGTVGRVWISSVKKRGSGVDVDCDERGEVKYLGEDVDCILDCV
jgi:hypothetical protein